MLCVLEQVNLSYSRSMEETKVCIIIVIMNIKINNEFYELKAHKIIIYYFLYFTNITSIFSQLWSTPITDDNFSPLQLSGME